MKYEFDKSIDDPSRTEEHGILIRNKPFLKSLYKEWYNELGSRMNQLPDGKIIELGSGGGFIKDVYPRVLTSDVMPLSTNDLCFNAEETPFEDKSVAAYFMLNVFHHIPNPEKFLNEALRTLNNKGLVIMVEPGNSFFSRLIYKNLHHEPFDTKGGWTIESTGPMSSSNQALPYIYFVRDRNIYESKFPQLKIIDLRLHTPFRYLMSGGVSARTLVPSGSFNFFTGFEKMLKPIWPATAMFMTVVLQKD